MSSIDETGFQRTRLDERLSTLETAMRALFGQSIDLSPDSIDGQTLGIFAESVSNLEQLAEDVYHSFNPQSATGVALSRLVQLNGIRRISGLYSTATLLITGQQGTRIPAGSLVQSATGLTFATTAEATIPPAGQITIPARSTTPGAHIAPAGTLNKIGSPVYGWQQVTNTEDAIPGRAEETDEQLRIRRRVSTSTPAQCIVDAIYGALLNTPEVRQARVFENDQDHPDANGLPPHSIYCVVEGGETDAILGSIWKRKTAGTTTVGDVSGLILDSQGNPHTLHYARPQYVDVWITLNLSTRYGWPTDGAARIAANLTAWALENQEIGEELIRSRLFDAINAVPGHSVTNLLIGTEENPDGTDNIAVPFDGLARLDTARITVNVSAP
jgi:uncharacterized phage protein gp47/JayE